MSAPVGSAARGLAWAERNIGAGVSKIAKWDAKAGFATGTAWCGIFLGALMRAQGITPPSGFAAATNWSNFGTAVASDEMKPGDILVYGTNHVAMYKGGGQQIQGNNSNDTVGTSGIGSSLGLGPITAIRRPPWTAGGAGVGEGKVDYGGGPLGFAKHFVLGDPLEALGIGSGQGLKEDITGAVPDVAGEVISGVLNMLGLKANTVMLNVGLVGGGAFLVYYGVALMAGVQSPVARPAGAAAKMAAVVPK
jgi:hypothetical protein